MSSWRPNWVKKCKVSTRWVTQGKELLWWITIKSARKNNRDLRCQEMSFLLPSFCLVQARHQGSPMGADSPKPSQQQCGYWVVTQQMVTFWSWSQYKWYFLSLFLSVPILSSVFKCQGASYFYLLFPLWEEIFLKKPQNYILGEKLCSLDESNLLYKHSRVQ